VNKILFKKGGVTVGPINLSTLPTLRGSGKQVKWAEDIRREVIRVLEECRKVAEAAAIDPDGKHRFVRRDYDRLKRSLAQMELAVELIDRFRWITKDKEDFAKIDDLKKGFPVGSRFLTFAKNHWFDRA